MAERELNGLMQTGISTVIEAARESGASWHPNGFVVFNLGSRVPGTLRLHIWPAGTRYLRDDVAHIHTHVWDLCSRVLAGTYREQMYAPADEAHGEEYGTAEIDYLRDRNTLQSAGKARLQASAIVTVEPGQVHTVPAGVAHETLIDEANFVATLLFVSQPRTERATVFSQYPLPSPGHTRPKVMDDVRDELLMELGKHVDGAPA